MLTVNTVLINTFNKEDNEAINATKAGVPEAEAAVGHVSKAARKRVHFLDEVAYIPP